MSTWFGQAVIRSQPVGAHVIPWPSISKLSSCLDEVGARCELHHRPPRDHWNRVAEKKLSDSVANDDNVDSDVRILRVTPQRRLLERKELSNVGLEIFIGGEALYATLDVT